MRKKILYAAVLIIIGCYSCQKQSLPEEEIMEPGGQGPSVPANRYSSDLIVQWLNLQLEMLRVPLAPGTGSQAAERVQAYCGIAVYQAALPGMPDYNSLEGQLTDFPAMPGIEKGKRYHWAASVNAALAEMNRKLFPTTSAINKTKIDQLEDSLKNRYATIHCNAR